MKSLLPGMVLFLMSVSLQAQLPQTKMWDAELLSIIKTQIEKGNPLSLLKLFNPRMAT